MLQTQRAVLKKACPALADYPTFRTACLQLKTDFDHAIQDQLLSPDEDWPEKDAKKSEEVNANSSEEGDSDDKWSGK